jgi:hypothetical protein
MSTTNWILMRGARRASSPSAGAVALKAATISDNCSAEIVMAGSHAGEQEIARKHRLPRDARHIFIIARQAKLIQREMRQ